MTKYRIIQDFDGKFVIQRHSELSARRGESPDGWEDYTTNVYGGYKTLEVAEEILSQILARKRFVPRVFREEEA